MNYRILMAMCVWGILIFLPSVQAQEKLRATPKVDKKSFDLVESPSAKDLEEVKGWIQSQNPSLSQIRAYKIKGREPTRITMTTTDADLIKTLTELKGKTVLFCGKDYIVQPQ